MELRFNANEKAYGSYVLLFGDTRNRAEDKLLKLNPHRPSIRWQLLQHG